MTKTEQIGSLVADCLDRCRFSGYSLATLVSFLDELRSNGQDEADVQWVDNVMRHILRDALPNITSGRKANSGARRERIRVAILERATAAKGEWVRLSSLFKTSSIEYMSAYSAYYRNGRQIVGVEFTNPAKMREVWFRLVKSE